MSAAVHERLIDSTREYRNPNRFQTSATRGERLLRDCELKGVWLTMPSSQLQMVSPFSSTSHRRLNR